MPTLTREGLIELKLKANDVRQGIIRSLLAAGSGHSAGPLDMSDIFAALYGICCATIHKIRSGPIAIVCCFRAVTSRRFAIPQWRISDIFRSKSS